METPKKKPIIKVQRIIGTLPRMLIWNAKIIFSRMTIDFFRDAGHVILKCIFREQVIFAFLVEG